MTEYSIYGVEFAELLTPERLGSALRIGLLICVGIPLTLWLGRLAKRTVSAKYTPQHGLISSKVIVYAGLAFVFISVMQDLGFPLSHLLGAAGVVGVAVGFASQTSVSNIISGMFLLVEKPFVVGDIITVGGTTGAVVSIDTLSVKLRTFSNQMVRIPNESLVKSEMTNFSHFPIRRFDLELGIAYKEDLDRVREILMEIADLNPLCLREPEPLVIFKGFGSSSLDMFFGVWCLRTDFLEVKNGVTLAVKNRLDEEGIEIPFPHMSLYAGSATGPIQVQLRESGTLQDDPPHKAAPQHL